MWGLHDVLRTVSVSSVASLQTDDVTYLSTLTGGRNSAIRIATRYRIDGGGSNPGGGGGGGEISRIRLHRPWGPPSLLYRVSFPRAKRPGRCVDHPPPPSVEVKERVKLYFCYPCALAVRYRENSPFPSTRIHYRMLRKACGNGKVNLLQTSQHYMDIRIRLRV